MGTSFTEVFDNFMLSVDDYTLTILFQTSPENLTTFLTGWLKPAVVDFSIICDQDLSYNLTTKTFENTLTIKNISMLAKILKQYWLQRTIDNVTQFRNLIQTDFKTFSAAQNYKTMQDRGVLMDEVVSQLLVEYSLEKESTWDFLRSINNG